MSDRVQFCIGGYRFKGVLWGLILLSTPQEAHFALPCYWHTNSDLTPFVVQGNLSEFVKRVPEAQAYYNLEAASTKFAFPEPGFLEGIKTKDKAILKMARVGFT